MALPFWGLEWKHLFQSCGHCWVFQICWHIECSTFTASTFRIWNSSTGIPSPSLALLVLMLSKAHLTSHSRMSGSRWVITPSWSSGSWRSFLYSCIYTFFSNLLCDICKWPIFSGLHFPIPKITENHNKNPLFPWHLLGKTMTISNRSHAVIMLLHLELSFYS